MSQNPSSCGGPGEKCPPKALTDKVVVNLGSSTTTTTTNTQSQEYLGIKPKPNMSKKMRMSHLIRSIRR